jgi:hypothetical protein
VALAATACGEGGSDEDDVKKTVNGVYDALADKDAGKVCDSLSQAGRRRYTKTAPKGQDCEQVFKVGLSFAGDALEDAERAEVTRVRVKGDRATASVRYKTETGRIELLKEDGSWKLNDLGSAGG